nr:hypothetical protein [Natrialba aegyptia]
MTDDGDAARNATSDGTGGTDETSTASTDTGETDDAESLGSEVSMTDPDNADPGDTTDGSETPFPRCPRCNTPIVQRTMIGPGEAIAGPCGCRVAPRVGTRSQSDSDD